MPSSPPTFMPVKGLFYAVLAAATYGTNPLFAKPLYSLGFDADSMLLVRYLQAAAILGIWMLFTRQNFRLNMKEFLLIAICGVLFSLSSLFLYLSYTKMDAGVASTLLFVYPVMVAFIMVFGFHEKITANTIICMVMSLVGVALLCKDSSGKLLDFVGFIYVMLSGLAYALYMIVINKSSLRVMPALKLTLYVILFGSILFFVRIKFGMAIKGNFTPMAWVNLIGMAFFSTVLSLFFSSLAIQRIGATITAVLGALEPVTAVFFGVLVFHEIMTWRLSTGVLLIIASAVLIALNNKMKKSPANKMA